MQLVILANGRITRMGELARPVPNPMIPLVGRPILEHQIELARRYGCRDIILLTGHLGAAIEEYFDDGSRWGVRIRYHQETAPLGTAGAMKEIESWLAPNFLVFHGDVIMDVDLAALTAFHEHKSPLATLVLHPNNHPFDNNLVEIDADDQITAFHSKPHHPEACHRNLASAALCVASVDLLRHIPQGVACDLDREIFPRLVAAGQPLAGYNTTEYLRNVGTFEQLQSVEADLIAGTVARRNRSLPQQAVFLDRDGVLNVEMDHVIRPEHLRLLPGVAEAVRRINRSDYLAVVVTNQPAVAKGFINEEELSQIHARLESLLGAEGAYLDRIYYCPHHPQHGLPGESTSYKTMCMCRKPAPGMVLQAAHELNVDLAKSFMVGDRTADVLAGASAGINTVLLRTGYGGTDAQYACRPDFIFDDLAEASNFIVHEHQQLALRAVA